MLFLPFFMENFNRKKDIIQGTMARTLLRRQILPSVCLNIVPAGPWHLRSQQCHYHYPAQPEDFGLSPRLFCPLLSQPLWTILCSVVFILSAIVFIPSCFIFHICIETRINFFYFPWNLVSIPEIFLLVPKL